jgi:hypothetical protein
MYDLERVVPFHDKDTARPALCRLRVVGSWRRLCALARTDFCPLTVPAPS